MWTGLRRDDRLTRNIKLLMAPSLQIRVLFDNDVKNDSGSQCNDDQFTMSDRCLFSWLCLTYNQSDTKLCHDILTLHTHYNLLICDFNNKGKRLGSQTGPPSPNY